MCYITLISDIDVPLVMWYNSSISTLLISYASAQILAILQYKRSAVHSFSHIYNECECMHKDFDWVSFVFIPFTNCIAEHISLYCGICACVMKDVTILTVFSHKMNTAVPLCNSFTKILSLLCLLVSLYIWMWVYSTAWWEQIKWLRQLWVCRHR